MIAIIDYDAGNIRSVEKALAGLGQEVCITRSREQLFWVSAWDFSFCLRGVTRRPEWTVLES